MWSGLSPTLVLAVPTTVVYFTSYEQLKHKLYDLNLIPNYRHRYEYHKFSISEAITYRPCRDNVFPAIAGSTARTFTAVLVSPLELIRTKMQSRKMSFTQIGDAVKLTLRTEGIMGLWKGCMPTLFR